MYRLLILFIFMSLITSCSKSPNLLKIQGETMGTTYSIKFLKDNLKLNKHEVKERVDTLLISLNQSMSTYIKSSEISQFNSSKTLEWKNASAEILYVTNRALDITHLTDGAYDPTIGPLVNLWGFGPNGQRVVPLQSDIDKAMEAIGPNKISLNIKEGKWKKNHPNVYIDLSSLAKGHGVDKVAELLDLLGSHNYMVEIGGEVRTKGSKSGKLWKIAIESPNTADSSKPYQKVLELGDQALATSGDYKNFFTENHKKYSHTLDYKTGRPVSHTLASVSVVTSESCMDADAWATALMALGFEKGIKLAEKLKIAAYFVYKLDSQKSFSFRATTEFNKIFR